MMFRANQAAARLVGNLAAATGHARGPASPGPSRSSPRPRSARGYRVTVIVSTSVVVPFTSGVVMSVLTVPVPRRTPWTTKL